MLNAKRCCHWCNCQSLLSTANWYIFGVGFGVACSGEKAMREPQLAEQQQCRSRFFMLLNHEPHDKHACTPRIHISPQCPTKKSFVPFSARMSALRACSSTTSATHFSSPISTTTTPTANPVSSSSTRCIFT